MCAPASSRVGLQDRNVGCPAGCRCDDGRGEASTAQGGVVDTGLWSCLRESRWSAARSRPSVLLQFVTEDDRLKEVTSPVHSSRRRPLHDGDDILVTYDPADPRNVVVHGRERSGLERAFAVGGAMVVLLSSTLLVVAMAGR
ncbi:DUF3592 domain-containing protein [Streptomyces sp. NPDC057686]|uniref:DUF3592 domain-containing protein n=1 Tax=Streptomyces sp. NPDC057686 TaxID=3346212 RepID=UPI0036ADD4AA